MKLFPATRTTCTNQNQQELLADIKITYLHKSKSTRTTCTIKITNLHKSKSTAYHEFGPCWFPCSEGNFGGMAPNPIPCGGRSGIVKVGTAGVEVSTAEVELGTSGEDVGIAGGGTGGGTGREVGNGGDTGEKVGDNDGAGEDAIFYPSGCPVPFPSSDRWPPPRAINRNHWRWI
jgi:hypothetical protein